MVNVIFDQLHQVASEPLHLPSTQEPRVNEILSSLVQHPASQTFPQWAGKFNVSIRTLSRLFERELGINFSQCRQQVRLLVAIKRLAQGQ